MIQQVILGPALFKSEGPLLDDLVPVRKLGTILLDQLATLMTSIEAARQDSDK